jgi:hypothetical protein
MCGRFVINSYGYRTFDSGPYTLSDERPPPAGMPTDQTDSFSVIPHQSLAQTSFSNVRFAPEAAIPALAKLP